MAKDRFDPKRHIINDTIDVSSGGHVYIAGTMQVIIRDSGLPIKEWMIWEGPMIELPLLAQTILIDMEEYVVTDVTRFYETGEVLHRAMITVKRR